MKLKIQDIGSRVYWWDGLQLLMLARLNWVFFNLQSSVPNLKSAAAAAIAKSTPSAGKSTTPTTAMSTTTPTTANGATTAETMPTLSTKISLPVQNGKKF